YTPKSVDLKSLLIEIKSTFEGNYKRQLSLEFENDDLPTASVDPGLLSLLLDNLLRNSVKHTGSLSGFTCRMGRIQDQLFVEVSDLGPGLSPEVLEAANSNASSHPSL